MSPLGDLEYMQSSAHTHTGSHILVAPYTLRWTCTIVHWKCAKLLENKSTVDCLQHVIDFSVWHPIKLRHQWTRPPASARMGSALNPERLQTEPCLKHKAILTGRSGPESGVSSTKDTQVLETMRKWQIKMNLDVRSFSYNNEGKKNSIVWL